MLSPGPKEKNHCHVFSGYIIEQLDIVDISYKITDIYLYRKQRMPIGRVYKNSELSAHHSFKCEIVTFRIPVNLAMNRKTDRIQRGT